jgi:ribonuclease HI
MLEDMICSGQGDEPPAPSARQIKARWRKPDTSWLKVNTDVAFTLNTGQGASGAVLRDDQGNFVVALAQAYGHVPDVLTAEALAARDGLKLAVENGAQRVCLEVDNTSVVCLLRAAEGFRSPIAGIWHEMRGLASLLVDFCIYVIGREGNEAAHRCAKMASVSSPSHSWLGYAPWWLWEIVLRDCNDLANE